MQHWEVKRYDDQVLELTWPDSLPSGEHAFVQTVLDGLGADIKTADEGADRWQWQFRWQDRDYVLFVEVLSQSVWVESGRVVTAPEDLERLVRALDTEKH